MSSYVKGSRLKCLHPSKEDVKSASGKIYGRRCLTCNAQWQLDTCCDCGVVVEQEAKSDRAKWRCRPCADKKAGATVRT